MINKHAAPALRRTSKLLPGRASEAATVALLASLRGGVDRLGTALTNKEPAEVGVALGSLHHSLSDAACATGLDSVYEELLGAGEVARLLRLRELLGGGCDGGLP